MTKTVRKLLGVFLCLCLLLPCLPVAAESSAAGADTRPLTIALKADPAWGAADLSGLYFEVFRIGEQDPNSPTGWKATGVYAKHADLAGMFKTEADMLSANFVSKAGEAVTSEKQDADHLFETGKDGRSEAWNAAYGIYYMRQVVVTEKLDIKVNPVVLSVSPLDKAVNFELSGKKVEHVEGAKTSFRVEKTWHDEDNFDNVRPESLLVMLTQNGIPYGDPIQLPIIRNVSVDMGDGTSTNQEVHDWNYTWNDLDATDEDGVPYTYAVKEYLDEKYTDPTNGMYYKEDAEEERLSLQVTKTWEDDEKGESLTLQVVRSLDGSAPEKVGDPYVLTYPAKSHSFTFFADSFNDKEAKRYEYAVQVVKPEGMSAYDYARLYRGLEISHDFAMANTHTPVQGWLKVAKIVKVDGVDAPDAIKSGAANAAAVSSYIQGSSYFFMLTGPHHLKAGDPGYHDRDLWVSADGDCFSVNVTTGAKVYSTAVGPLVPGTYTVKEVTTERDELIKRVQEDASLSEAAKAAVAAKLRNMPEGMRALNKNNSVGTTASRWS